MVYFKHYGKVFVLHLEMVLIKHLAYRNNHYTF